MLGSPSIRDIAQWIHLHLPVRPSHRSYNNVTRSMLTPCSIHWIRGGRKTSCDGLANEKKIFQGASPWKRVLKYIIPVIIFSALFNIPKFFETAVVHHTIEDKRCSRTVTRLRQNYKTDFAVTQLP